MNLSEIRPESLRRQVEATLDEYFGIGAGGADALAAELEPVRLAGGEWLMRQGDPGDALYLLIRGRLQAWRRDDDGHDRGRFLNEIVPGDSVGELSLLTGAPRVAGIQAIRDSLLLRLDRKSFERLTASHPALTLKLAANVASLLQGSNRRSKPSNRNLKTISVLPLDDGPQLEALCQQLVDELQRSGNTLALSPDELGRQGAPVVTLPADGAVPESLRGWLQDQESSHRFVVYRCAAENSPWSRYVLRQSDMVLLVGDAAMQPAPRGWERELLAASGATIARKLLILLQPSDGAAIRGTAGWLEHRQIDFHTHARTGNAGDVARIGRIVSGTALGLVLGGGAARGFAHLGVYRAMRELGLPIDWVGGASIGAIMGAVISLPQSLEESMQLARAAFVQGKPFSDFTLPMTSLIRGRRMARLLEEHAAYRIEDLPIPLFCISCSLDTGATNVHELGYLPDALRASAAMPGIIPPAVINRRLAIDGGVVNNLPVNIMQGKPVGRIVAVNLSSREPVEVDYDEMPSPWQIFRGRHLPFTRRYRVPGLSTIILKSSILGTQKQVSEQARQADVLLNPPVRKFSLTGVKSFDKIVEAGYECAMSELSAWLEEERGPASE